MAGAATSKLFANAGAVARSEWCFVTTGKTAA
jgi:hypothetical protein